MMEGKNSDEPVPEEPIPGSEEEKEDMEDSNEELVQEDVSDTDETSVEDPTPEIPDEVLDSLEDIDEENPEAVLMAQLKRHAGPLPSPETLYQYKEISPRAVDWIFDAATKEQEHRHWINEEPLRQSRHAQNIATGITVLVILIGAGLIYQGKSVQGLAAIMGPLAAILGIFIYREVRGVNTLVRSRKENNEEEESR